MKENAYKIDATRMLVVKRGMVHLNVTANVVLLEMGSPAMVSGHTK